MLNRFFAILLIPLFLINSWSYIISPSIVYAMEDEKITPLSPETVEAEPVEIPVEPAKKGTSVLWYILGAILIGGIAAAAGGGGGGSNSSGSGGSGGTIPVTW